MSIQEQEEADFVVATDADWDRAEARDLGERNVEVEWVLTDRDVWHKNPFYTGEPGRHPEDDWCEEAEFTADNYPDLEVTSPGIFEDDIPF